MGVDKERGMQQYERIWGPRRRWGSPQPLVFPLVFPLVHPSPTHLSTPRPYDEYDHRDQCVDSALALFPSLVDTSSPFVTTGACVRIARCRFPRPDPYNTVAAYGAAGILPLESNMKRRPIIRICWMGPIPSSIGSWGPNYSLAYSSYGEAFAALERVRRMGYCCWLDVR